MRRFPLRILLLFFVVLGSLRAIAQDAPPAPLQVPPEAVQKLLLRRVAPTYPPLARQARIQGAVVINVIISKTGEVRTMQLVSGHPMLAPSALEAVKQWRYRSYEQDGVPVEIQTTVQINFSLPEPSAEGIAGDGLPGSSPNQSIAGQVHLCESSPDSSLPNRVRVSQGVMRAMLISKRSPAYPEEARKQFIEGTVLLAMEIGRDGAVCDIALISGHPLLAPAAIDAVRQWKYRPYLLNNTPVEVESQAQVNFTLTKK
jgi:TonB family protein